MQATQVGVAVAVHCPLLNVPTPQCCVHVLQTDCDPVTSWYVLNPHGTQRVDEPAVELHEPLRYVPTSQLTVQALHAVCAPAVSWNVLSGHGTHDPVPVAVQLLFRNWPTPHDSVQSRQAVRLLATAL